MMTCAEYEEENGVKCADDGHVGHHRFRPADYRPDPWLSIFWLP